MRHRSRSFVAASSARVSLLLSRLLRRVQRIVGAPSSGMIAMLVTPFLSPRVPPQSSLSKSPFKSHRRVTSIEIPATRDKRHSIAPPLLVCWLAIGIVTVVLLPVVRGGATFGATLPFWLIAAPLLDLVWLRRQRWLPLLKLRRRVRSRRLLSAATRIRSPRA